MAKLKILPAELREIASVRKEYDMFTSYIKAIKNPDFVLSNTVEGLQKGMALYDEMIRKEPLIRNYLRIRANAVANKKWDIFPASERRTDKKIAEFVEKNLTSIGFTKDLKELFGGAVAKGFAVSEIMWEKKNGMILIADIKNRAQKRFVFDLDMKLKLVKSLVSYDFEEVPERKFIVFSYDTEYENCYGSGVLQTCFWPWWFKRHAIKFWMIYIEKFAMPTAVGEYPPGLSKSDQNKLLDALEAIQNEYAIAIPQGTKVWLLEAQRSGSLDTYDRFIKFCDKEIANAILGSYLITQEAEFGTRAQAQVQYEVAYETIEADSSILMDTINNQLIKWLVDYNFDVDEYPVFKILFEDTEISKEEVEKDKLLIVDIGLPVSKNYLYEKYNIPPPEEGEEVVIPQKTSMFDKLEFQEQEDIYEEHVKSEIKNLSKIYEEIGASIKKSIEKTKLEKIKDIKIGLEKLANFYTEKLFYTDLYGRLHETQKKEFQEYIFHPLPPEEAIKFFSRKLLLKYSDYKRLLEQYRKYAFSVANIERLDIINTIYEELLKDLKEGKTYANFKKRIGEIFEMHYSQSNPHHLETVYRTNLFTAYNAGKYQQAMDPDVMQELPYFRYVAVMDSRTRPEHAAMHNFVARKDDPIWDKWYPPNGFNCRCTVVSVDREEASKLYRPGRRPSFLPDEGFNYNPGQIDFSKGLKKLVEERRGEIEEILSEILRLLRD